MKIHIPPFKIQGIKTKLIPLIKENILLNKETLWIEPFMGSGVVGLNLAPAKAIFADLNPNIVEFYQQLKEKKITSHIVRQFLIEEGQLLAEQGDKHYYEIRERFNKEGNPLDFLFLNRSCFNGMVRFNRNGGFNVPYCHKSERFSKAYITKIVNQVSFFEHKLRHNDWEFLCQPFEKTISLADFNSFIYCDPPYIDRHVDYFDSWDAEQEEKLKECLEEANSKYMVSTWLSNKYRENQYVRSIWEHCEMVTQEHYYFVGAKEENRNAMTEALLTNYKPTKLGFVDEDICEQIAFIV